MKRSLDGTDWELLRALQKDARAAYSDLAKHVGLTPPAVSERVRRLEDAGIIRGYGADLDLQGLGYPMTAIVRLAVPSGRQCTTLLESLAEIPEVLEAFRVTGTDSAIIRAVVSSSEHLEDFINRLAPLGKPTTSIVTSSFKRNPSVSGPPFSR